MNPRGWLTVVFFGVALSISLAQPTTDSRLVKSRPTNWAVPVNHPGLPNCFQLTTNFYRGAQPTKQGLSALKALGIRTVINLRTFHSDAGKLADEGLAQERFKMEAWRMSDDEAVHFLKIVGDTNHLPVFVHCERGADRTGTMCALYRIAGCGWSKADAIQEMKEGGFGFNPTWQNLVNYLEQADVEKLKRRAGWPGK